MISESENEVTQNVVKATTKASDKKQFDFFLLRTCFRTMDEFYKEKFQDRKLDYDKKDGIASIPKAKMDLAV